MIRRQLSQSQLALIFTTAWCLLNLLQAIFTNLHSDEVYYWTYSWNLRWGYWDNAPLIGLYIFLGDALFPFTEIGVRLLPVLSGTLAIYILWLCTDKKDALLFFMMLLGMALLHAGGFLAAPDSPLALSGVILLYAFKQYINTPDWKNAIWIGIAAALVMYSKYQGAMLIGMIIISRPKQLLRKEFWFAILIFLIAFAPGLYAMYQLDFSTFQYHLSEKNPEPWKWNWTTDFVLGQILSAGPLLGLLIIPLLFVYKPADTFLRSMRITAIGIYIFLFVFTFKINVLGNWAAPALFPMILVSYDAIRHKIHLRKWALRLSIADLVLVMCLRVYIVTDLPLPKTISIHFRSWENWASEMQAMAGDRPVVFFNSFQFPSRYAFHNKTRDVFALSNYDYHPTQYDYTKIEDALQGREVLVVSRYNFGASDSIVDPVHGSYYCFPVSHFCSYQKAVIEIPYNKIQLQKGEKKEISVTIYLDAYDKERFSQSCDYSFYIGCHVRQGSKYIYQKIIKNEPIDFMQNGPLTYSVEIIAPDVPGNYDILFSLATDWHIRFFGTNGRWIDLDVTN